MAFAIGCVMCLTACGDTTTQGSETETAICDAWGQSLPTRSRDDTPTTIEQITRLYATFAAACPAQEGMIP
jgi:hypothetical protein